MNSIQLGELLQEIAKMASTTAAPLVAGQGPLAVNINAAVGVAAAIALKALEARQSVTGQPIDLESLKPYIPVV